MKTKKTKMKWAVGSALALLVGISMLPLAYNAQNAASVPAVVASKRIQPIGRGTVTVTERTPQQIDQYEATFGPVQNRAVPFRPTMSDAEYAAVKAAAAANPQPSARAGGLQAPLPLHGITGVNLNFAGGIQSDNGTVGQIAWFPPDTSGAVGSSQFVTTYNNYINVYSKGGLLLKHFSGNALTGSSTSTFDPRVQWDRLWGRWVITYDSFPIDSTHQLFWIAISKTASATGSWWVFSTNTNGFTGAGSFFDYPSLGLSQDAMIITANVFGTSGFLGAFTFALAKAQHYNGHGQGFPVFGGLIATLQPPNVDPGDTTAFSWLAAAPPGGSVSAIDMYVFVDPSNPDFSFISGPFSVSIPTFYSSPAPVSQTCGGGSNAIDTLDGRFQQAGAQIGDNYYQVHAAGSPVVQYFIISGLTAFTPVVAESSFFFESTLGGFGLTYNPSIAANSANNMVITYSATHLGDGLNAEVEYVGKQAGDPAISGGLPRHALAVSAGCLTNNFDSRFGDQRWGDYSQVSVDPIGVNVFWVLNEDIIGDMGTSQWGNQVGKIHF